MRDVKACENPKKGKKKEKKKKKKEKKITIIRYVA